MPKPTNPSTKNKHRNECEVCYADSSETAIYRFKGTTYCGYDRDRAIEEGWHND
jgi:hypothetical protein